MDYMNNRSETFNGVEPCLFSSFKEKVNIKTDLATPPYLRTAVPSPFILRTFENK
jgi:hypothetical protein